MRKPVVKIARNTVLFVAGLLGAGHELLISKGERPTLLLLLAGMMGFPAFLPTKDEKDAEK